jgi:hypothetical protein
MRNLIMISFVLVLGLGACAGNEGGDDTTDPGEDDPGETDTCVNPDDGLGETCVVNDDCACGTTCAQRECVAPSACDEALVTWLSPIQNTDGTCLTNMAGFNVYWGTTQGGPYENMMDLGMPCVETEPVVCAENGETAYTRECSFRLTDLPNGDIYFIMTTYNTEGDESPPSGEAAKTISCP